MDAIDRSIINQLQTGFPICSRPYLTVAERLRITEEELISRLSRMLDQRLLSRFGPMYHAERMGGGLSLCALCVRDRDFDRVAEQINSFPEVAHNYARDHRFNMWFVLAAETSERIDEVLGEIEKTTGYRIYNMPKQKEFFVGLRFEV